MKLLFDQNLSHKLATRLSDLFPESLHVRSIGMRRADDHRIWEYAKANGFTIVPQDADFSERVRINGPPPKVVWLHCGNQTRDEVEATLRMYSELIQQLDSMPKLHLVEIQ